MKRLLRPVAYLGIVLCGCLVVSSCSDNGSRGSALQGEWLFRADPSDEGMAAEWFQSDTDTAGWIVVQVPAPAGLPYFDESDGVGWYWKRFDTHDTTSMTLLFHSVDDDARVWLNGIELCKHKGSNVPFWCEADAALRAGTNSLIVRVTDRGGPGGMRGQVSLVRSDQLETLLASPISTEQARPSPEWVRNGVIYEVYLRSFSPDGTFEGLRESIPVLQKMGVTILWLMPIHPVGELNRKGTLGSPYSVSDYYGINEEFGSQDDFRRLVQNVHEHGMKIIIDLVANHTSWDSKLILEHPDWFTTDDEGAIVAPNADWYDVADLNYDHHELRKYMLAMMEYWVREFDIDGYRCDVSELVPLDFWERARIQLEDIKPVLLLSEGSLPEHHLSAFDITYAWNTYDILGEILEGRMPASMFHRLIELEALTFPHNSLRLRFNTNHDKNAWDQPAVKKFGPDGANLTTALMFTLPGVPLLYNGEEVQNEARLDLFERVPIDWGGGRDLRSFYAVLAALRTTHPALVSGEYLGISNSDEDHVLSFARTTAADTLVALFNFSDAEQSVRLGTEFLSAGDLTDLVSGSVSHIDIVERELFLDRYSFKILTWSPFSKEVNR